MFNIVKKINMEAPKLSTIIIDNYKVDELRNFARKNNLKPTKENIIDLALEVAISVYKYADEETLKNLTNKNK